MKNSARAVVDKMFAAFKDGDVEKLVETVSEDTVWIYHGTLHQYSRKNRNDQIRDPAIYC